MTRREEQKDFKFDVEEFRALNNKWAKMPQAKAVEEMRKYCNKVLQCAPEANGKRSPRMGRVRVYLETTMFNWYFERDHAYVDEARAFFAKILEGGIDAYTSTTVLEELQLTPEPKRKQMLDLVTSHNLKILDTEQNATDLANTYINMGVIPAGSRTDGVHIAVANINGMDFIVSFNFRHINRSKTKIGTAFVNHIYGYVNTEICTPMEVIYDV